MCIRDRASGAGASRPVTSSETASTGAARFGASSAAAASLGEAKAATETSLAGPAPPSDVPPVAEWGLSVFRQFDTDKDGKLSNKELSRALKSLPKTKPK